MVRKSEVVNCAKLDVVRGLSEEDFCTFSLILFLSSEKSY